ncbi:MAG: PAS domain-containing protein [Brevundimonas sp.]|nr:MAG: PAS domain-containing protein [Brevundimonas sp.]
MFAASLPEVMSMFHSDTQALLELWSRMARDESGHARAGPARTEAGSPGARLARTFLVDSKGQIRLAGGWIETLHDRALGDTTWLSAWQSQSRIGIELALRTTLREARRWCYPPGLPRVSRRWRLPWFRCAMKQAMWI